MFTVVWMSAAALLLDSESSCCSLDNLYLHAKQINIFVCPKHVKFDSCCAVMDMSQTKEYSHAYKRLVSLVSAPVETELYYLPLAQKPT